MDIEQMRAELAQVRAERDSILAELDMEGAPEVGEPGVKRSADRVGALLGVWQAAIYKTICAMVPAPDRIDGAGSDAGALELTLSEVAQGLSQIADQRDELEADATKLRTDLRHMTEHADKLAAEVAALRAEVETLRQGWQAERDAATRAHDLLIAERAVRS